MIAEQQYNRFCNLDSITERIINYLIKSDSYDANRIWKLLKYSDKDALLKENLTQEQKAELIDDDGIHQSEKKVFRYPFLEDSFTVRTSLLRIYIDSVVPKNHLTSVVNIGFDIISHNKISNIYNDSSDPIEDPEKFKQVDSEIMIKSRNDVLLKSLLSELNGKDVEGVGRFVFDNQMSPFAQAKYGLFNNKNYCGFKLIIPCLQSGVS